MQVEHHGNHAVCDGLTVNLLLLCITVHQTAPMYQAALHKRHGPKRKPRMPQGFTNKIAGAANLDHVHESPS
ncbi:hypothetical protein VFPPC_15166 [Pochonia chlamydosporia 170]|uniref:Uncharacterized protein n=1 Tax=Pochonia chlamydosporia 170 TaxID=1380566 RepID=A0A179G5I0_METCM|nr:hypothetical protein VFPPC_15166 [Pochonia chlamydosporia 170]OAQ72613.1 hypothetical protein VFPPC_15166 [Pochonia chlamydosporia 170]